MNDLYQKKRIIFMSSDYISIPLIQWLYKQNYYFQLVAVISNPKKYFNNKVLIQNDMNLFKSKYKICFVSTLFLNMTFKKWIKSKIIDLILVMGYGEILDKEFLLLPKYYCINYHASILPKYRGASPIEASIIHGETKIGISGIKMISKMDKGCIVGNCYFLINNKYFNIKQKISSGALFLLKKSLLYYCKQCFYFIPQREYNTSYTRKIKTADYYINFLCSTKELIHRLIAWQYKKNSYFTVNDQIIKIKGFRLETSKLILNKMNPGWINPLNKDKGLPINSIDGVIYLTHLQKPGGKVLPVSEFIKGYALINKIVDFSEKKNKSLLSTNKLKFS